MLASGTANAQTATGQLSLFDQVAHFSVVSRFIFPDDIELAAGDFHETMIG